MRVEVLGQVRAWRGAVEVTLGPARQRAVFVALALHAGRPVARTELISAVWGHDAPASADGSIHTYVSGLRRALEPDLERWSASTLLTGGPTGYSLRDAEVDALEFERLIHEASRCSADSAKDLLDDALALWHGDPLSGVPGPFAERERTRLAELRLDALERRAEARLATNDHHDLSAELAGLVREYPLREKLRELQMLALYRNGRRTEALDAFRVARETLAAELEVEPGEGLRRMHDRILAQDPALVPDFSVADQSDLDTTVELLGDRLPHRTPTPARSHHDPEPRNHALAARYYWTGRWTEALASASRLTSVPCSHGLAALIAARRDDRIQATSYLEACDADSDFLWAARALLAEQRGEVDLALSIRDTEPMLSESRWMPDLLRLALTRDDSVRARRALSACELDTPVAQWCRGLFESDSAPVLAAARHFQESGRRLEFASASEDAAVLLARSGELDRARSLFEEVVDIYDDLSARWDLRRAESRLGEYGIHRASSSMEALSCLESEVARLVADGLSNVEIAARLDLPEEAVREHISRLLRKLHNRA